MALGSTRGRGECDGLSGFQAPRDTASCYLSLPRRVTVVPRRPWMPAAPSHAMFAPATSLGPGCTDDRIAKSMLADRDERLPRHPPRSIEVNPRQVDFLETSKNVRRKQPASDTPDHLEEDMVVAFNRHVRETRVGQPRRIGIGGPASARQAIHAMRSASSPGGPASRVISLSPTRPPGFSTRANSLRGSWLVRKRAERALADNRVNRCGIEWQLFGVTHC